MIKIKKDKNVIKSKMPKGQATVVAFIYYILIMSLYFLFTSCKKIDENGFKTYIINQGSHYSNGKLDKLYGNDNKENSWQWQVIFDSSAIYKTQNPLNQLDVNKLIGFSDCGNHHSTTSHRIGWRYNNGLELLSYNRNDGNFLFQSITIININEIINIDMSFVDTNYIICIDGICDTMPRTCSTWSGRKFALWPYFGGNETAPHDITIKIKNI